MKYDITNEQIEKMCYDFKALADETRIRIILYLLDGEKSVNDISRAISSSQSATSHQLRILKDYHILKCRKQGTVIFYKIADKHVENIIKMSIVLTEGQNILEVIKKVKTFEGVVDVTLENGVITYYLDEWASDYDVMISIMNAWEEVGVDSEPCFDGEEETNEVHHAPSIQLYWQVKISKLLENHHTMLHMYIHFSLFYNIFSKLSLQYK